MSVTAAAGFRAAGVSAGLKAGGVLDVALVVNEGPVRSAAAVFTSNRVKAAPVLWSQQVLRDGRVDAVVLNSGGANACTGPAGFQDTHATAEWAAMALGVSATDVAVCSTGLIGDRLPIDRLLAGVDEAVPLLDVTGADDAARAIMTTDSVPKQSVVEVAGFVVGGMAKGAGMLAPGLATMLVVLTTDAAVEADRLDAALRRATATTFDRVDSDGCMSTNDTVLLLASGSSGVAPTDVRAGRPPSEPSAPTWPASSSTTPRARPRASRSTVTQAATTDDAVTVARAVARSNLLKCAIHGEDPNWGRVLSAVGTTDAVFEPDDLAVALNGVWVCRNGAAGDDRDKADLSAREVTITVDLAAGEAEATVWTNDLTADYVHENSAYST